MGQCPPAPLQGCAGLENELLAFAVEPVLKNIIKNYSVLQEKVF